jgi:hypothetical protein
MAQVLFPGRRFTDTNGNPIAGGKLEVYEAGTTTPLDTFTDAALTVASDNPIILDSAGLIPVIYAAPDNYKFVLKSSDEATTYWTIDDFTVIDPETAQAVASTTNTSNTGVAAEDYDRLFNANSASGEITVTADSATLGSGFRFIVRKTSTDANSVTISGTGGQTINGAASYTLAAQYDSAAFQSNGAGGWDVIYQNLDTAQLVSDNAIQRIQVALHCGQFRYASATICTLFPHNGNYVCFPNGDLIAIGASGVSSTYNNATINGTAAQTLSADTTYYAYVYNNSGTLVIDWSTTGPAWDSATGIRIKTGDATRVLVGLARTNSSSQFDDSATKRNVASWNNRRDRNMLNSYSTTRAFLTATPYTEVDTEIRVEFVTWGDSAVHMAQNCVVTNADDDFELNVIPAIDGSSSGAPVGAYTGSSGIDANDEHGVGSAGFATPAVGHHYITVMATYSSGSVTFTAKSTLHAAVTI